MRRVFFLFTAWMLLASSNGAEQCCPQAQILQASVRARSDGPSEETRLDWSFAQEAVEYLKSNDSLILDRIALSPAAAHLLQHVRNFNTDLPKQSAKALVTALLQLPTNHLDQALLCEHSEKFFSGPMLADKEWIFEVLKYAPEDFQFQGARLFLTYGYDIGVAYGGSASLNCAHPQLRGHPRELLYYAIHELHHVAFMKYQPPPTLSDIKTYADIEKLVEYATQLEGMAVLAAWDRREKEGALSDDDDYIALRNAARMRRVEASYFAYLRYLRRRRTQPADAAAWRIFRIMLQQHLWYQMGALMSMRIEQASGRAALVALIKAGPQAFLDAYQDIRYRQDVAQIHR
jgi:hypothetical protein